MMVVWWGMHIGVLLFRSMRSPHALVVPSTVPTLCFQRRRVFLDS